jgi:hypothetical protein
MQSVWKLDIHDAELAVAFSRPINAYNLSILLEH